MNRAGTSWSNAAIRWPSWEAAFQNARDDARVAKGPVLASLVLPVAFLYVVPLLPLSFKRYPDIRMEVKLSEDSSPVIVKRFDVDVRAGARWSTPPAKCRLSCSNDRSLLNARVNGLGNAQLPQPMILDSLRAGGLRCVLPAHAPEGWQLFIHLPSRKRLPARVRERSWTSALSSWEDTPT